MFFSREDRSYYSHNSHTKNLKTKKSKTKKYNRIKISLPKSETSKTDFAIPKRNAGFPVKRTSLCTSSRASLTVEAAWSVPLFFLCVVSLLLLMTIYGKYISAVIKLQQEAETLGVAVSAAESGGDGIIDLTEQVSVSLPFWPFDLGSAKTLARARVHAWVGRDTSTYGDNTGTSSQMVYVTENQSVYHTTSKCTHLSLSIHSVSGSEVSGLRNEYGSGYKACEKCVGSGGTQGTVYITEEGDRYHNSLTCSGLTRKVEIIDLEEVSGLRECSRCAALEA